MNQTKHILLSCCLAVGCAVVANAQLTIGPGTTIEARNPGTTIAVSGNVNFISANDTRASFNGTLALTGINQSLTANAPVTLGGLSLLFAGNKNLAGNGEWTVTNAMTFNAGILVPGTNRIVYTGNTVLIGNVDSHVNGTLYQRGTGTRFFPVGAGGTYAPIAFTSVTDGDVELGVQVFNTGANLTLPLDVSEVASNRYWMVSTSGGTFRGSPVSLYMPGTSLDASQRLVAVQADDETGATAINLGGGATGDFVTSFIPATKPVLTIGIGERVDIRIHDLITPFNADNINDRLKIVNVEYVYENKVTLLDRWGVPVKTWKNFRNYDDPVNPNTDNFDFSRLSPGNYICILEYQLTPDSPAEKLTQMITVLK
ncbi:MAG: gliding motility-associated C-terminal domain-containing protein [Cyclobacteriaceae bacterium]|nr:gliding motility-associated C-terminal domain-containing protein [Cyclobacteriaceae bacterium]